MMPKLIVNPLVRPPFFVETPSEIPTKTKMKQTKGRANFLWISTQWERHSLSFCRSSNSTSFRRGQRDRVNGSVEELQCGPLGLGIEIEPARPGEDRPRLIARSRKVGKDGTPATV